MDKREIFKESRDELTGLLDKPAFYEWAQELIDDADEGSNYAFIFLDMENFKQFNANYGFEKGDDLLKDIAHILRTVFDSQLVSRFSGDHFVVCSDITQVVPAILEVKKQVKSLQQDINLELKAGVYLYDGEVTNVIRCTDRARIACASIKKKYDIDYKFYDAELGGHLARKQFIIDNLVEALANKYIQIYYQPIVRSLTGEVCGWEALVRWIDPNKGTVYPNEFISVLEEYHLIHKLDCYVMEEVISTFAKMEQAGMKEAVPVSINLSRIDFEIIDIASYMNELLDKYQVKKELFHLEITESALTKNPEFIREQISRIRNCGIKVWMDDFGSGYSSLNVLKNYEFDLVKIDMEFLRGFDVNDNGKIILKHAISMLKNLGFHTLAEGVETKEQYDFLRSLGCELIQGYYIGRPVPLEEGCEQMHLDGRDFEKLDERHFYNKLGLIDLLKQNPLRHVTSQKSDALPLAIGIVKNKKWSFLYINDAFQEIIDSHPNAQGSLESVEKMINTYKSGPGPLSMFWELCFQSKQSGLPESIEFVENGKIVNMRIKHVTTENALGFDAYLLSIRMLTHYVNESYEEITNTVGKYMFSLFECVDLFGIDTDYFENIYLFNSKVHVNNLNKPAREVIEDIALNLVHEEDRESFKDFMNIDTIEERLIQSNTNVLEGFFYLNDVYDNYVLKAITLKVVYVMNQKMMLSCLLPVSQYVVSRISQVTNLMSKKNHSSLNTTEQFSFRNILNHLPIGVFWKDSERRFLGANHVFLEYYGFPSVDYIIGKTDEDMGWHINPEPFKQDELKIIKEGRSIIDAPGECIVQGQVRNILATKQPYVVNGNIIGLVGYFIDVTEHLQKNGEMKKLASTDSLTGLMNRRGFDEIIPKFIKQYKQENLDFAVIVIDVNKFKQYNDIYGHTFGDTVLTTVSEKLKRIAGSSSVVIRYGGDEYVILHQYAHPSEVESIMQEIDINMAQIKQIENENIKITVSKGYAFFSDHNDIKKALDAADKKMYETKKNR